MLAIFRWIETSDFRDVHFSDSSLFPVVSFESYFKILPSVTHRYFSVYFFIIVPLMFKPLIYLELIFVHDVIVRF